MTDEYAQTAQQQIDKLRGKITALEKQVEELRKDKERLDWLITKSTVIGADKNNEWQAVKVTISN